MLDYLKYLLEAIVLVGAFVGIMILINRRRYPKSNQQPQIPAATACADCWTTTGQTQPATQYVTNRWLCDHHAYYARQT